MATVRPGSSWVKEDYSFVFLSVTTVPQSVLRGVPHDKATNVGPHILNMWYDLVQQRAILRLPANGGERVHAHIVVGRSAVGAG